MKAPKEQLKEGAALLERILKPHDFRFKFGGSGHSSGGDFAYGAFVRKERRLEIHVRSSLGLVSYSIGDAKLDHESYMHLLGVFPNNKYPSFSDDVRSQFAALAEDIERYCDDFVGGDGEQFRRLARKLEQNPSMFKGLPA